jgi:hypothetical protein
MELELYSGGLLKKSKKQFKYFKKFKTKILDVDNFEIYNPIKSQFKIGIF